MSKFICSKKFKDKWFGSVSMQYLLPVSDRVKVVDLEKMEVTGDVIMTSHHLLQEVEFYMNMELPDNEKMIRQIKMIEIREQLAYKLREFMAEELYVPTDYPNYDKTPYYNDRKTIFTIRCKGIPCRVQAKRKDCLICQYRVRCITNGR